VLLPVELSLNLRLSFKVGGNKHAEYFKDSLLLLAPFLLEVSVFCLTLSG